MTRILLVSILLMFLFACGPRTVAMVPPAVGTPGIVMKASNFDFQPEAIVARPGDRLLLQVENVSGREHNITVRDPHGRVVVDQNLPPETVVPVELVLKESGRYPFFCDKPLHPLFGMQGYIEVR